MKIETFVNQAAIRVDLLINYFHALNTRFMKWFTYIDLVILVIFIFEMLIHCVAWGFLFNGKQSYLRRSGWNILNLGIVVYGLVAIIERMVYQSHSQEGKLIRMFRLLRVFLYNKGLRIALISTAKSLKHLFRLTIILLIVLFFCGAFFEKFLKGEMYFCDGVPSDILSTLSTKTDCFDYGGSWVKNDISYNTIFDATYSLFTFSSSEGWSFNM